MPLCPTPSALETVTLDDNPRGLRSPGRACKKDPGDAPLTIPVTLGQILFRRPRLHERRAGLVRLPMLQRQRDAATG